MFSRLAKGKEFREAFVESEIDVGIPIQIKLMRESRGWTQKSLADKCGKRQSVISQLEDINYGRHTLSTLKTLAAAFDVALMVRFVPFSELAKKAMSLQGTDLAVPDFSQDNGFSSNAQADVWTLLVAEALTSSEHEEPNLIDNQTNLKEVDSYVGAKEITASHTTQ